MSVLKRCVLAARLADDRARAAVERRVRALARFYGPLGESAVVLRHVPELRLLYGAIVLDGSPSELDGLVLWGGPLPRELVQPERLLSASERELRQLDGVLCAVAAAPEEARLVTGAGGMTTLYAARSELAEVWATHAVAAATLAYGEARVNPAALPELLALGGVGGDRTLLEGVSAVPTATCITLTPQAATARSYWPPAERWAPLPESEAFAHAEGELLASLARRLDRAEGTFLGLTSGLDSRTVAVALRELGVDFEAFTWGEPGWADAEHARAIAERLGVRHRRQPVVWHDDHSALEHIDRLARWTDGSAPAEFTEQTWPPALSTFVNGLGGETARTFYYRETAHTHPHPSAELLLERMSFRAKLEGTRPDAVALLRSRLGEWIAETEELGYSGWRCLDVLYTEQRVRRWGRSMQPHVPRLSVPAFLTPELSRALVSLPHADRVGDGFHRRFLAARIPDLVPSPPAAAARKPRGETLFHIRRGLAPLGRPVVRRLRHRRRATPWFAWPEWQARPRLRSWLSEDVLNSRLVHEGLGEEWGARTRGAFLRDEHVGTTLTLQVATPVALDRALRELSAL